MKTIMKILALLLLISVLALIFLSSACKKSMKDEELILKRKDYTGEELKLGGYYYKYLDGKYFGLICFYKNGILLYLGGSFSSEEEINDYINNEFINRSGYQKIKSVWGLFDINGNNIKFEQWRCYNGFCESYTSEGTIINDTSFHIETMYKTHNTSEKTEINQIYYFRPYLPTPDSTNNFIK